MALSEDDIKLQKCLKAVVDVVHTTINEVQDQIQQDTPSGTQLTNSPLDINIHTFSLNPEEESIMEKLQATLENELNDKLLSLSSLHRKYLLELLHEYKYDYDSRKFMVPFNRGVLEPIVQELEGTLASIEAFQVAFNGEQTTVQEFIEKYPIFKNRSGLWGTTLLYSAARNNHLQVVEYLIRQGGCSIDALNQHHIRQTLPGYEGADDEFGVSPTAASTALHGACYNGHLKMVMFLVQQGANYFAKNQALETPIMNAQLKPQILKFFREYLILGYSLNTDVLPNQPISEENRKVIVDCIWEYKPFDQQNWYPFSSEESGELHTNLLMKSDQSFKYEVHLKVRSGVYSVAMVEFLRSGKDLDYTQRLAWVRCRGSSILNYDCYALWQIMFVENPNAITQPSVKMLRIPVSYDSTFQVRLDTWYYCNAKTNDQIEKAMDYRRTCINLDVDYACSDELTFNLQDFSFRNRENTISGYIRWIPKMISNNERNKGKILSDNDYEIVNPEDMIPLTRTRLQQITDGSNTDSAIGKDELDGNVNEDVSVENDDNDIDDGVDDFRGWKKKKPRSNTADVFSLHDITNNKPDRVESSINNDGTLQSESRSFTSTILTSVTDKDDETTEKTIDECINEIVAKTRLPQQVCPIEESKTHEDPAVLAAEKKELEELRRRNQALESDLNATRMKVEQQMQHGIEKSAEYIRTVQELSALIDNMEEQQRENRKKEEKLQQKSSNIKEQSYPDIQVEVVNNFLAPKYKFIIDHLRSKTPSLDKYFVGIVPKMEFQNQQGHESYVVNITGFQEHHKEFKNILQRIWSLLNVIQSAKDFYQRHLNRILKNFTNHILPDVKLKTRYWKEYLKLFIQVLEKRIVEYAISFNEHITEQIQVEADKTINGTQEPSWVVIRKQTNDFMQKNDFMNEIEYMKRKALEDFIEQNIMIQKAKLVKSPSTKSVGVMQHFLEKVRKEFKTNKRYSGHKSQHFYLIPNILERLMVYYNCFKIQLPLFESSQDLLDKIEENSVTTIATSTGSGKSTLLPALLIAEGYDKVIVTQPRRLPCQLIAKRVNETMEAENGANSEKIAGWAVSGREKNPQAKVLYVTDGLLKERLLYDKSFITSHTKLNKSVVFFIDEVHERSVNIDLCLAFLAQLFRNKPELKSKMKVIISSATLDSSVPNLFREIPQVSLAEFTMPQMGTLFRVQKIHRPNENILDIVQELCQKRQRLDQILCFVSSVTEVNQCCRILKEISRGMLIAQPLVQSQHPDVQRKRIEHETIFFSTMVAETSLTFPSLKYVVDSGMINMPVYDIDSKRTVLKEVRAAESTLKQRLGRLGRTQPGEYYSVYHFKVDDLKYPKPQICQTDLMNLEFSLRKSPLKHGLNYIRKFLPNEPSERAITSGIQELKRLGIMEGNGENERLTEYGKVLSKLPDFGSLSMSKAVLAALREYNCGRDLIALSSILGVLNTTTFFKALPQQFKSADGDFMTLLNVMNDILLLKGSVPANQFNLDEVCQKKGLSGVKHIIAQVMRRYTTLEKSFKRSPEFSIQAQWTSGDWTRVARALLTGYGTNIFVSMKELKDRVHRFVRYSNPHEIAVLDLQSTLARSISATPVSIVLARDIRHSTAIRATAILSFIGAIKADWLEFSTKRKIALSSEEETYLNANNRFSTAQSTFSNKINMQMGGGTLLLTGPAGPVLNAELHLRQQMVDEMQFSLTTGTAATTEPNSNMAINLQSVTKMTQIFNPLKWRWETQKQVEITINGNTATKTCDITVKGRDSDNKKVKKEFDSFMKWLRNCAVIRHPSAGNNCIACGRLREFSEYNVIVAL
ncbi:unnamed protein product [Rotaria magnacalcarata]|uniref:RNA helicase n=2 Tax=Rotaria magnacalcarata TaxID=392030 RepID=A0A816SM25_9BILA|nr:unnamed protein product [Rotaria magnacalcarata]CAF3886720.1 unnamed protein product [Rotaria magnacalcarata]